MRKKMITFEDLKSEWEDQPVQNTPINGAKDIIQKVAFLNKKQQITSIILTITIVVLLGFFFYITAYKNTVASIALILMASSLLVRVFIEFFSIRKLQQIKITVSTKTYKSKIVSYSKNRLKTHYVITPIILIMYSIGFIMLLPIFKQGLSYGFYIYILISGILVLITLALFIRKQILKELSVIKELKN